MKKEEKSIHIMQSCDYLIKGAQDRVTRENQGTLRYSGNNQSPPSNPANKCRDCIAKKPVFPNK